MRNTRYTGAASGSDDGTVSLMENVAVNLTIANVAATDCTLRISYTDDAPLNTILSNVRFFAYDPINGVDFGPTGITVVAAERYTSSIYKDRDSDVAGDGGAWDSSEGIGGVANALICSSRGSVATHLYYFLVSASPTSAGLKTGRLRFEFDAS